jgi:hypothetical protein
LNFLYLQILNAQSSGGSGSSSSGSNFILPLLSNNVSYRSDINSQSYSLTVFLNSLEQKIIDLQNAAPAESGSGLSIEQEKKLDIIGIPHSADSRLFLDPAYSIAYTQEYLDPVLNFTDRIRLQQRDPYLPIDIKYDNSKGALVIKMNTPTIILPDQFQVRFHPLADTISFIRPGFPYDTTDKYYKATLKFGSDSQNISSSNVNHNGSSLYGIINTLQTKVETTSQLTMSDITHITGPEANPLSPTLKEGLSYMSDKYNYHTRSNGDIVNMTTFLNYLDKMATANMLNAGGISTNYPAQPPVVGHETSPSPADVP